MKSLKHIGKIAKTKEHVLVVFRTLPGDAGSALVLPTAGLSDTYHEAVNQLVETIQAQDSGEFGEILFTRLFPDGRPMLRALRADGLLHKVPTDTIIMLPAANTEILLSDLNVLIAEQRNCAVDDLCHFVTGATTPVDVVNEVGRDIGEPVESAVLSDTDLASTYRRQAAALVKEAADLSSQADLLDPQNMTIVKPVAKIITKPLAKAKQATLAKTAAKVVEPA
jgi:hypothetical protein